LKAGFAGARGLPFLSASADVLSPRAPYLRPAVPVRRISREAATGEPIHFPKNGDIGAFYGRKDALEATPSRTDRRALCAKRTSRATDIGSGAVPTYAQTMERGRSGVTIHSCGQGETHCYANS